MPKKRTLSFLIVSALTVILVQSACNIPVDTPTSQRPEVVGELPTHTPANLPTSLPSETPPAPTITATATQTPIPSETPTPTITPTWAILRGKVLPERANCRYGPGPSYLYKYGLVGGSNLEIIGRNDLGTWVLIQAIGGNNPCWVKAELMQLTGDVYAIEPVDIHIVQAWSPYYDPLTGVSATREGDVVTVYWNELVLRAGDDAEQVPYMVEAWVCRDGVLIFVPQGAYGFAIEIIDEAGCEQPSYGRVLGAEKHGYTWPTNVINWPQHPDN